MPEYDLQEQQLVKRLDLKILPMLMAMCVWHTLVRTNLSPGSLMNIDSESAMARELNLSPPELQWISLSFYIASALFALPSNLAIGIFRPSRWLGSAMAALQDVGGFVAIKVFLGITGGGYLPAVMLYMTFFYTQQERGRRFALILAFVGLIEACSPFLALVLEEIDGIFGLSGWRWLFLGEGLGCLIIGLLSFKCLADYPSTASYLTVADRVLGSSRLQDQESQNEAASEFNPIADNVKSLPTRTFHYYQLTNCIQSYQLWMQAILFMALRSSLDYTTILIEQFSLEIVHTYLPSTEHGSGHSSNIPISAFNVYGQLLTTLPFVVTIPLALKLAEWSDSSQSRSYALGLSVGISVGSLLALVWMPEIAPVHYIFLVAATVGSASAQAILMAFSLEDSRGTTHRASTISILIAMGYVGGGIVVPLCLGADGTYKARVTADQLSIGYGTTLAAQALALGGVLWTRYRSGQQDQGHLITAADDIWEMSPTDSLSNSERGLPSGPAKGLLFQGFISKPKAVKPSAKARHDDADSAKSGNMSDWDLRDYSSGGRAIVE